MRANHDHLKRHLADAWLARGSVLLIAALQLAFVNDLAIGARWLEPAVELALLVPLSIGTVWTQRRVRSADSDDDWHRVGLTRRMVRRWAVVLTAVATIFNCVSLAFLLDSIVSGHQASGRSLLIDAVNIWITNVVIFALWFWIGDRGGPSSRGLVPSDQRDFLFTQQQQDCEGKPGFAEWLPGYVDYLFLAYTNATAFSPADTFPLTTRAKLLMMAESLISLLTIALVASRAVGILN